MGGDERKITNFCRSRLTKVARQLRRIQLRRIGSQFGSDGSSGSALWSLPVEPVEI